MTITVTNARELDAHKDEQFLILQGTFEQINIPANAEWNTVKGTVINGGVLKGGLSAEDSTINSVHLEDGGHLTLLKGAAARDLDGNGEIVIHDGGYADASSVDAELEATVFGGTLNIWQADTLCIYDGHVNAAYADQVHMWGGTLNAYRLDRAFIKDGEVTAHRIDYGEAHNYATITTGRTSMIRTYNDTATIKPFADDKPVIFRDDDPYRQGAPEPGYLSDIISIPDNGTATVYLASDGDGQPDWEHAYPHHWQAVLRALRYSYQRSNHVWKTSATRDMLTAHQDGHLSIQDYALGHLEMITLGGLSLR